MMTALHPWRVAAIAMLALGSVSPSRAQSTTHTLFAEALGAGGLASVNYELTISSVAVRGGLGYMFFWPSYPLTVSYRFPGDAARFEIGGGVVFIGRAELGDEPELNWVEERLEDSTVIGVAAAALRYELRRSPLMFRVSVTAFGAEKVVLWPGAGLGFRFSH